MKIRNLDEISDEIGDFGRMKNNILDNVFLVSLPISAVKQAARIIDHVNWLLMIMSRLTMLTCQTFILTNVV